MFKILYFGNCLNGLYCQGHRGAKTPETIMSPKSEVILMKVTILLGPGAPVNLTDTCPIDIQGTEANLRIFVGGKQKRKDGREVGMRLFVAMFFQAWYGNRHIDKHFVFQPSLRLVCLLVGSSTSQQHASVSQGRICSDNFTCCQTEISCRSNFLPHPVTVY